MWFILLSFFCVFFNCHSTYGQQPFFCHQEESSSFLQFKQSIFITDMDSTCPPSTVPCCSCDGDQCNNDSGHVIALHLSSSFIHGSINSTTTLFRLIHLTRLNLSSNYFSGQIPPAIFLLSNLVSLELSDNPLKFQNPGLEELVEKFPGLIELNLIGIFHLPNLCFLILRHNPNLTGNLWEFQLHSPIELLRVENTGFSGQLPESIGNLKSLNNFLVTGCKFSEKLPIPIGSLEKMKILDLSGNNFSGMILSSVANLHKLTYLSLSYNNFSPQTLNWVGNLTNLDYLNLTNTNSNSEIPSWLGNFTQITWLKLAYDMLRRPIRESVFGLPDLQVLVLFSNRLNGTLSSDLLLNSTSLSVLQLSDNNLSLISSTPNVNVSTDLILPQFESLGLGSCNLKKFPFFLLGQNGFEILDLSHNKIVGLLPRWVSDLATESLGILNLDSNSLTGIEQDFNVLPWNNLLVLNLSANQFEGSLPVPQSSIFIYTASSNKFGGEISKIFCGLTSIWILDLSDNKLRLPQCLGHLSNFVSVLDSHDNNTSGEIPDRFVSGCTLRMLDLSQNKFKGMIPRSLAKWSKLQALKLGENRMSVSTLLLLLLFINSLNKMKGMFGIWISLFLVLAVIVIMVLPFSTAAQRTILYEYRCGSNGSFFQNSGLNGSFPKSNGSNGSFPAQNSGSVPFKPCKPEKNPPCNGC